MGINVIIYAKSFMRNIIREKYFSTIHGNAE